MSVCTRCKAIHSPGPHQCPPAWDLWLHYDPSDSGEEPDTAYGPFSEDAAKWAAEHLVYPDGGDDVDVWCRLKGSQDQPEALIVEIRQEISFYARRA